MSTWSGSLYANAFVGRRIRVRADDLFEGPIEAVVIAQDPVSDALLLRFSPTAVVDAERFEFAVSSVRNERESLDTLRQRGTAACALTFVPVSRYDPARPFDHTWWRGGAAAIADLILLQPKRLRALRGRSLPATAQ